MYVRVRVTAGAKKERVVQTSSDHFDIMVKEPAAHNRANVRVCALVAEACGVAVNAVRIVSGHHAPTKIISVEK